MTAPTDKSMPPVIRIGVNAIASRPSSAFRRAISRKLASVKKLGATCAKIATSTTRAAASAALRPCLAEACIPVRAARHGIGRDRHENDRALNRPLPVIADAEKRESRANGAE